MDSPKHTTISTTTTTTAASLSGSSPVQESPFSNFASKLSPIKPVKAPHTVQGLFGLNSPPLVFTSPRISTLHESIFLKRLQHPHLSNEESPRHDNCIKKVCDVPSDVVKTVTRFGSQSIANALHDDPSNPEQVQPSSSSECVDEYLADPLEVDCVNSARSSHESLQEINSVSKNKDDSWMNITTPLALSEKDQEHCQEKSITDVKLVSSDNEQRLGDDWLSSECPITDTELCANHVSVINNQQQQRHSLDAENVGEGHQDEYDRSPDFQCRPMQTSRAHEISNEPVTQRMHDREVSQNQRGVSRRCLQFEESQPRTSIKRSLPSNLPNDESGDFESLNSSDANFARNRELVELSQPVTPMFPTSRTPLPVPKPLGIGLHLNSIVNTVSVGHGATPNMKLAKGHMTVKQINSVTIMPSLPENNCSKLSYSNEKVTTCAEDWISETRPNTAESSPSGSFQIMENANFHDKRMFNSENEDVNENSEQQSPQKKRKKSSSTKDGNGCKRCNCKKTKCLKLYCDCFAAGVYCDNSCACQGCFNKPEYQDTIQETKRQIESRNPTAFAPKVVPCATEFAAAGCEEHGNRYTPSSARHKRGCNCKRSMCLKKYCECYQANVGCSIGCRCEGCKNVYGKKKDYDATREMASNSTSGNKLEGTFDERLEIVAGKKVILQAEIHETPNLTPNTPSFPCSDHGKEVPKSRFISRRNLESPDSDLDVLSYIKSPGSPRNEILKTSTETLEGDSYSRTMDNEILDMDQFLPLVETTVDPTSAPNSQAMPIRSSVRKSTLIQLGPGNCCLSSGGSLLWRSSPVTPAIQIGETTKTFKEVQSGSDFLEDDNTPEILKNTSTPTNPIEVSSPNRKRVSPPRTQHELGSSSSGPFKSRCRFILKAVAFPPLTPCVDSKNSINQSISELQEKEATSGEDKPL